MANEDGSSADLGAAVLGALFETAAEPPASNRGVPGGMQGLSATSASAEAQTVDAKAVSERHELSPKTAALLGLTASPDPVVPANSAVATLDAPAPTSDSSLAEESLVDDVAPDIEEPSNIDDEDPAGFGRIVLEWAVVLIGAVVMALLLRQFVFQAFWIPSESMESTLAVDDRVLVNRLSYRVGDVGRGDVIVFSRLDSEPGEIRDLIKRVIALPGETIEGRDNQIYIDGTLLKEDEYVAPENLQFSDFGPVTVPEDEVFVMGDNRDQSFDSRFFGTIHEDRIAGRAVVLYWPLSNTGWL